MASTRTQDIVKEKNKIPASLRVEPYRPLTLKFMRRDKIGNVVRFDFVVTKDIYDLMLREFVEANGHYMVARTLNIPPSIAERAMANYGMCRTRREYYDAVKARNLKKNMEHLK